MDAGRLKWCEKQKKGIKLIEPNDNLALEYLRNAEETLSILSTIQGDSNMWLATTKYYCEYFAVYSFLIKIGVKSEIHDCTLVIVELFEDNDFLPKGTSKMLEGDKKVRIDNQYYLKNTPVELKFNEIRNFVLTMKDKVLTMTLNEKETLKELISKSLKA
jgi:uncharacterized protein (UPF0332 family)